MPASCREDSCLLLCVSPDEALHTLVIPGLTAYQQQWGSLFEPTADGMLCRKGGPVEQMTKLRIDRLFVLDAKLHWTEGYLQRRNLIGIERMQDIQDSIADFA